jgi:hypothetical protein
LAGDRDTDRCMLSRDGHQFARPTNVAMAGTVRVRTTKVSNKTPTPITNPPWTTVVMLENSKPHIEAAKIKPAAVITPPVDDRVRMTP